MGRMGMRNLHQRVGGKIGKLRRMEGNGRIRRRISWKKQDGVKEPVAGRKRGAVCTHRALNYLCPWPPTAMLMA